MYGVIKFVKKCSSKDNRWILSRLVLKENIIREKYYDKIRSWYNRQLIISQVDHLGTNVFVGPLKIKIWKSEDARIRIEDDVRLYSPITLAAVTHIYPKSTIEIGKRTRIGAHSAIRAAKKVTIGQDCLIANYVRIYDYNGHPIKPHHPENVEVLRNRCMTPPEEVKEVSIGNNVWIGENSFIQKGVSIGDNSIVSANSVVIKDVPKNVVVFGSPARIILWLDKTI